MIAGTAARQRSPSAVLGSASEFWAKAVQCPSRAGQVRSNIGRSYSGSTNPERSERIRRAEDNLPRGRFWVPWRALRRRLHGIPARSTRSLRSGFVERVDVHSFMDFDPAALAIPDRYKLLIGCIVPRPIA